MTTETKNKVKTISYSAISIYLQCPLKYRLSYVDKLEPEWTTDSLLLGSVIHKALEVCLKRFKQFGKLMKCTELQETFCDILQYELSRVDVKYGSGRTRDQLRRMGMNMLSFWRSSLAKDILSINEIIAVEERFCLDAHDPEHGYPLSHKITGVIDLIVKLKRWPNNVPGGPLNGQKYPGINAYLLMDHKTAVQRYQDFKIDRDFQLTAYQWAALKLGLIPDRELTMVGFSVLHKKQRPEFSLHLSRRTEYQEIQMLKLFSKVIDAIEMELFYPSHNIMCSSCPWMDSYCAIW